MEKRRGMYITIFVILFLNRVKNFCGGSVGLIPMYTTFSRARIVHHEVFLD